jgi:hypothetical protein
MKALLEERAFLVDTHALREGPLDLSRGRYAGLIVGTPVFGLGWRGVGPTPALRRYLDVLPGLEGMRVAIFCVHELRPGDTFDRLKNVLFERGAEIVAEHAYPLLRPRWQEHIIPAECMVRIR